MKYYLYIIETLDDTLYCGTTNDVFLRFETHKKGKGAKYTKAHKPKKLVYVDVFDDFQDCRNVVLHVRDFNITDCTSRTEFLELCFFG